MANVDKAKGLKPIRHLSGAPYNGQANRYHVASATANIFIGDPVRPTGTADSEGILAVEQCPGTEGTPDSILGVVVAIEPNASDLDTLYSKTGADRYVYVADAPDLIFELQEDGTSAITAIGTNMDVIDGGGSTSTGLSGYEADSDTTSASDGQVRVIGLRRDGKNALGANAVLEVMINEHELNQVAGS